MREMHRPARGRTRFPHVRMRKQPPCKSPQPEGPRQTAECRTETPVYRKFPSVGRRAPRRQSAHREMSAAAESRRKHTGESGTLRMELLLRFREIVCESRLQTACRRAHALIARRTKDNPLYFRRNAARCRRTVLNAACQRKPARRAQKASCGKAVRHRHAPSAAGFRAGAVRSSPSDRGRSTRGTKLRRRRQFSLPKRRDPAGEKTDPLPDPQAEKRKTAGP